MLRIKESTKNHKNQLERWLGYEDGIGKKGIELFEKNGIAFVGEGETGDIGISWHGFKVEGIKQKDCILMKNEPPIYYSLFNRKMNNPGYNKKFLCAMASHRLEGFDQYYYNIPRYEFNLVEEHFGTPKERLLCMILRNKNKSYLFNKYSPGTRKYNTQSLIKFRQMADKVFCQYFDSSVYNSYGGPWKYPCYCGEVKENGKWEVFAKYKFTFCPENSRFYGYVCEKAVQPQCCGSVPIYFGAYDVNEYLPKGTFINYANFKSVKSLCEYITGMDENEYNIYLRNIKKFVTSQNAFSSVLFAMRFLKVLNEVKK